MDGIIITFVFVNMVNIWFESGAAAAAGPLHVSAYLERHTIPAGATMVLLCSYPGMDVSTGDNLFTWSKDERYILKYDIDKGQIKNPIFNPKSISTYKKRVTYDRPGYVQMTNVQYLDEGHYKCKIHACSLGEECPSGEASYDLTVVMPTVITHQPANKNVYAETPDLLLNVIATYDIRMPISVEWLHNNRKIKYNTDKFQKLDNDSLYVDFRNMTLEDKIKLQGEYTVVVHSGYSEARATAMVTVMNNSKYILADEHILVPARSDQDNSTPFDRLPFSSQFQVLYGKGWHEIALWMNLIISLATCIIVILVTCFVMKKPKYPGLEREARSEDENMDSSESQAVLMSPRMIIGVGNMTSETKI